MSHLYSCLSDDPPFIHDSAISSHIRLFGRQLHGCDKGKEKMKKKRYLRPVFDWALTIITVPMVMLMACLDSCEIESFPYLLIAMGVIAFNCWVLKNYSKIWREEND